MSFDDKAKNARLQGPGQGVGTVERALGRDRRPHGRRVCPRHRGLGLLQGLVTSAEAQGPDDRLPPARRGWFPLRVRFGAKATEAARQAKLPKVVLKAIDEAPVYAEGRGFRLEVRTEKDVKAVKTLAAIKMTY